MYVLGIETTCDETAASVVQDGKVILSNVIASQAHLHEKFGGVFPELASRQHVLALQGTLQAALIEAGIQSQEIDLISVAKGPGLIGPLLIGLHAAKALSFAWEKPFVGVNHVEAHLYAAMMPSSSLLFPGLGIVLSGGHTFLALIHDIGSYEMIGTTVDDALGEALDKIAQLLDLSYPGGPAIELLAQQGNPSSFSLKAGKVKNNPFDFSFSGLKTNVFYTIYGQNGGKNGPCPLNNAVKADLAASVQDVAFKDIISKAERAAKAFGCKAIYVGGGVSQNQRLRELFSRIDLPIFWPPKGLSLDNAAMIAGLGYHVFQKLGPSPLSLEPMTRISLNSSMELSADNLSPKKPMPSLGLLG